MKALRNFGVCSVGFGVTARPSSPLFRVRGAAVACALPSRAHTYLSPSQSGLSSRSAACLSSMVTKTRSLSSSPSSSRGLKWTGGRVFPFEAEPMEGFYERPTPVLLISGEGYSEKIWSKTIAYLSQRGYGGIACSLPAAVHSVTANQSTGASAGKSKASQEKAALAPAPVSVTGPALETGLDYMEEYVNYFDGLKREFGMMPPVMITHSLSTFVGQKFLESYALAGLIMINPIPPKFVNALGVIKNNIESSSKSNSQKNNVEGAGGGDEKRNTDGDDDEDIVAPIPRQLIDYLLKIETSTALNLEAGVVPMLVITTEGDFKSTCSITPSTSTVNRHVMTSPAESHYQPAGSYSAGHYLHGIDVDTGDNNNVNTGVLNDQVRREDRHGGDSVRDTVLTEGDLQDLISFHGINTSPAASASASASTTARAHMMGPGRAVAAERVAIMQEDGGNAAARGTNGDDIDDSNSGGGDGGGASGRGLSLVSNVLHLSSEPSRAPMISEDDGVVDGLNDAIYNWMEHNA